MSIPDQAAGSAAVRKLYESCVQPCYGRLPLVFARGEGAWLFDMEGRRYLDWVSGGRAGSALGHSHPAVTRAIQQQVETLVYVSNDYHHPWAAELARLLAARSYGYLSFFCNSGAEANEAAIKMARKWGRMNRGEGCHRILSFDKSFHGRTMGALAATAQPQYHAAFQPLPAGFEYIGWGDETALEAAATDEVCAIILEPVQGESGIHPAAPSFMRTIQELCAARNILFIVDEVQTGFGRSGRFWAHEHYEVQPDIITTAKALGGGLPLGACIASERASVLRPGDHGCTFGGNPLSTAAAVAALNVLETEGLVERAARMGSLLMQQLERIAENEPAIAGLRGLGLMLAIEFSGDEAAAVVNNCLDNGLLVHPVGNSIIRLLPPLILSEAEAEEGIEILRKAIAAVRSPAGTRAA